MAEVNRRDDIQGDIVHVYDGIEEADNSLPLWWLVTFYGAIVFAIVYWFYFHELGIGQGRNDTYAQELEAIEAARGDISDEGLQALLSDDAAIEAGKATFVGQCVVCHDAEGQGKEGLGPNLTDKHWIHGGAPSTIYATISQGVGAKGMPAWEPVLGAKGTRFVTAYVLTMRNTMVEGRPPEGEIWEAPAVPEGGDDPAPEPSANPTDGDAEDPSAATAAEPAPASTATP